MQLLPQPKHKRTLQIAERNDKASRWHRSCTVHRITLPRVSPRSSILWHSSLKFSPWSAATVVVCSQLSADRAELRTKGHPSRGQHKSDLNIRPQERRFSVLAGFISNSLSRAASGPISWSAWPFIATKPWSLRKPENREIWKNSCLLAKIKFLVIYSVGSKIKYFLEAQNLHKPCPEGCRVGGSLPGVLGHPGRAQPRMDQPPVPSSSFSAAVSSQLAFIPRVGTQISISRAARGVTGEPRCSRRCLLSNIARGRVRRELWRVPGNLYVLERFSKG